MQAASLPCLFQDQASIQVNAVGGKKGKGKHPRGKGKGKDKNKSKSGDGGKGQDRDMNWNTRQVGALERWNGHGNGNGISWECQHDEEAVQHKTTGQSLWRAPLSARSELHPHPLAEQPQASGAPHKGGRAGGPDST